MKIKAGVKVQGLKPEILLALMIIEPILVAHRQELVITAGIEGRHSAKSRHRLGMAVDVRSRDVPIAQIGKVEHLMHEALGDEFYIKFETHHYHIQFNGSEII